MTVRSRAALLIGAMPVLSHRAGTVNIRSPAISKGLGLEVAGGSTNHLPSSATFPTYLTTFTCTNIWRSGKFTDH